MKKLLLASALATAAIVAVPAAATTFPTLTTIYVGSGVADDGLLLDQHLASTVFDCTNFSGVTATVRFFVRHWDGTVAGSHTVSLATLSTVTGATGPVPLYFEDFTFYDGIPPTTDPIAEGTLFIQSTQSAVVCNAKIVVAVGAVAIPIPLVRFNPHPGVGG